MGWINFSSEYGYSSTFFTGMLFIFALFLFRRARNNNMPPGPQGIPFLGYTPFLGVNGAETLRKLKSKYGPVMSAQLGMKDWVILNDFDVINECLVKQGEAFSGRRSNEILDKTSGGKGIVLVDYGRKWKLLRKFGFKTLLGFGLGKKGMEEKIIEETPYLLEQLTKDSQDPNVKFTNATSNIVCQVTFGRRFDYNDKTFTRLRRLVRDFFSGSIDAKLYGIITAVPLLQYFPIFRGALQRFVDGPNEFLDVIRGIIKEHRADFDNENIRDVIDAFLKEIHDRGSDEAFSEEELAHYIRDTFHAGTGTSSSTLTWCVLALLNYPDCEAKIWEEIERTIGDSGIPSMKHCEQMNYTCAFVHEVMRHRTLAPTSVTHKTNKRVVVKGYTIPEETPVIPNIWAVHHDPELFEQPKIFKPERFLNESGKFVRSHHVIPFSLGPRRCLGEQLARIEIFIFLTRVIQKMKILPDPSSPPPPFNSADYAFLLTFEPPKFRVRFEQR